MIVNATLFLCSFSGQYSKVEPSTRFWSRWDLPPKDLWPVRLYLYIMIHFVVYPDMIKVRHKPEINNKSKYPISCTSLLFY